MTLQFYYNGVRLKDGEVTHPLEKLKYSFDLPHVENIKPPHGSIAIYTIINGWHTESFSHEMKEAFPLGATDCISSFKKSFTKSTYIIVFPAHPLYEAVKAAAVKKYTRNGWEIPAA